MDWAVLVTVLSVPTFACDTTFYRIETESLGGGQGAGSDVNDFGVLVGTDALPDGAGTGFVRDGGEIVPLPGAEAALGINNRSTVVGTTGDGAALWQRAFGVWSGTALPTIEDAAETQAAALNDDGRVAGTARRADGSRVALTWLNGLLEVLPPLEGGGSTAAGGVNGRDRIVGTATSPPGIDHAVVWERRAGVWTIVDLGPVEAGGAVGRAINDDAVVVGDAFEMGGLRRGFRIDGGGVHPLPHLAPDLDGRFSTARAVGPGGVAYGQALGMDGPSGVAWPAEGVLDLNDFVVNRGAMRIEMIDGTNGVGVLAGQVMLADGSTAAAVLVPLAPGDLDGDERVGMQDLMQVLGRWGACSGCVEDADCDGIVGMQDLLVVLSYWDDGA